MANFLRALVADRRLIGLLLLASIALGAGLGLRDPSPPDEPRFVLAARHMIESGDWLVPHRGREFYAEKPPVFMWMQAASFAFVGDWRVAFLLPSLLAGLATLWLTADMAKRLWGRKYAVWAAAALLVCLQFGLQAKRGQIDMVLVGMTTLSLWGLLRHLLVGPDWKAAWLGAFAAGLGTVTKGVGFLPLLVLLPWILVRRDCMHTLSPAQGSAGRWFIFLLAFIAGTAVWLGPLSIALLLDNDPALRAYASELLFHQTANRYANAWHHVQPVWYYLQVIATVWLPGALLLPWLLPAWSHRLKRGDPRYVVLLGWAILVLIFFSISPGKREVYLFPILPALCVAAAPLLPALLRKQGVRRMLFGYVLVMAAALTLLGSSELFGISNWTVRLAEQRGLAATAVHNILVWLTFAGLAGLAMAAVTRLSRSGTCVLLFTTMLWLVYGIGLTPALDAHSSARALMESVGRQIGPDAELGLIDWREQNLLQADRAVTDFGFKQPLHAQWAEASQWVGQAPQRRWLLVLDDSLSSCVNRAGSIDAGRSNRRSWLLVPGTAISGACLAPGMDREDDGE